MRGGGGGQPEKYSIGTRGSIAEVAQFAERGRIKTWGQRSEWGRLRYHIVEGSSSTPLLTPLIPFSKGGVVGGVEGKLGEGHHHDRVFTGNNGDGGGGGPGEGMFGEKGGNA